jgi:hypothetical protein
MSAAPQPSIAPSDLSADVFVALREVFFDPAGVAAEYELPDKEYVQGDPFDTYVTSKLQEKLPAGVECQGSTKPLTSPDIVVARPLSCDGAQRTLLRSDLARIVGVEVKKFGADDKGVRDSVDFNSTPPCGTIRVYDKKGISLEIPGFYLFVTQEKLGNHRYRLVRMVMMDGNVLNSDFRFYMSIAGPRTKAIGVGSYKDGIDRQRPMVVFPNPLTVEAFYKKPTLVTRNRELAGYSSLSPVGVLERTVSETEKMEFSCYRIGSDIIPEDEVFKLTDPFSRPNSTEATRGRGKFFADVRPLDT